MIRKIIILLYRLLSPCALLFRRRAADRESPPHRFPGFKHCFR